MRNFHWMTEDRWYQVSYVDFALRFYFERGDYNRPKIHIHKPLDENLMEFMYPLDYEENVGSTTNLYTYYQF